MKQYPNLTNGHAINVEKFWLKKNTKPLKEWIQHLLTVYTKHLPYTFLALNSNFKMQIKSVKKVYFKITLIHLNTSQGGRGHWTVYYSSPQRFIITFSYNFLIISDCSVNMSVQTFHRSVILCIIIRGIRRKNLIKSAQWWKERVSFCARREIRAFHYSTINDQTYSASVIKDLLWS